MYLSYSQKHYIREAEIAKTTNLQVAGSIAGLVVASFQLVKLREKKGLSPIPVAIHETVDRYGYWYIVVH